MEAERRAAAPVGSDRTSAQACDHRPRVGQQSDRILTGARPCQAPESRRPQVQFWDRTTRDFQGRVHWQPGSAQLNSESGMLPACRRLRGPYCHWGCGSLTGRIIRLAAVGPWPPWPAQSRSSLLAEVAAGVQSCGPGDELRVRLGGFRTKAHPSGQPADASGKPYAEPAGPLAALSGRFKGPFPIWRTLALIPAPPWGRQGDINMVEFKAI